MWDSQNVSRIDNATRMVVEMTTEDDRTFYFFTNYYGC